MAKVLIVDDEPEIVEILESFIEDSHSIETVTSFKEAEKLLKSGQFDLVLSDLNMPGVVSSDLIHNYLEADSNVLIMIMSGYGSGSPQIENALKSGAHAFIEKPFFDPGSIVESIDEILASHKPALAG